MKNRVTQLDNWFHKYFRLDKEYFEAYNAYATGKLRYSWFKKLIFSILGGVFIGLGYSATLLVYGYDGGNSELFKFLGALLFPVGLILCIYLGGNLFTSNCMGFISIIYKDHKVRHYIVDLALILIGNGIGCTILALLSWGGGLFGGVNGTEIKASAEIIIEMAKDKIGSNHQWWNNLLSAILCNVLIVGTTMVHISTSKSKIAGIGAFVIYLMLVVFAISGYQHVVANFFLFGLAGFLSTSATNSEFIFTSAEAGQIFYVNLIPTVIGNLIGGIIMSGSYLAAQSFIYNRKINKPKAQFNDAKEANADSTDKKS